MTRLPRRAVLSGAAGLLSGCKILDGAQQDSAVHRTLAAANSLTYRVQRALQGNALAPEYTEADIRQGQRPNGSTDPQDAEYLNLKNGGFADWRLDVGGLVDTPLKLSLADLKSMESRTQITRHDCVEGWSCIASWTGTPLAAVLDRAGVKPSARFVLVRCYDTIERALTGEVKYYESIDMIDARHPQTILAWGLNGGDLPVRNGAPVRMRVERQLGYKMAKYIRSLDLVDSFADVGRGYGSYWADRGYDWYAGI